MRSFTAPSATPTTSFGSASVDVIVVAPGGVTTGGPEALHQLVDSINRQGGSAGILYWPPKDDWVTPERYRGYRAPIVTMDAAPTANVVVLSEIATHLRPRFPASSVGIWWLSVDNFFALLPRARTRLGWRLARSQGWSLHRSLARRRPSWYVGRADFHLTQSDHASGFLRAHGIDSTFIGDHVGATTTDEPANDIGAVVTNGNRGIELRQRFEALHPSIAITPLRGLSAEEVAGALHSATVYIDFGHQPGRDRLPREASIRNCVVLAHRAGAGANDIDMAIPDQFRFDATDEDLRRISGVLTEVLRDPAPALAAQRSYREQIPGERDAFDRAVAEFFGL